MGIFQKFTKEVPLTENNATINEKAANSDPESQHHEQTQNSSGASPEPVAYHVTPEAERRVVRKLDTHLVPLVMFLYLLAYLDRSNIGNAKIAGMDKALSLSSSEYQWLLTIFYIAYILFEPLVLLWKLIPPHIWAAILVLGWGLAATLQSVVTNWSGMMACRFFLGVFEAGFGPGVPYLLSFFYLRHEIGMRIGIYVSAAPLASCFAGALAYGITSGNDANRIKNWRLLFLVEGLPCIIAAAATWFLLPDSPEKARFLNEEERLVARARVVRQVGTGKESKRVGVHLNFKDIGVTLLDLKVYLTALMYFSCNVSYSSLPVFLPQILVEFGPQFASRITAQGLSAPPYFLAFVLVILTTHIADRTAQRGITIMIMSVIGAIGYILLATTEKAGPRYTGVYLAAAGIFSCVGNILPWTLNNQGSDTKRGTGIAILNLIGQCGPLLGTRIYPADQGPYYRIGMWVCASFMIFNGFLAFSLRCLLAWENRKLDRKYGERVPGKESGVGEENDGPTFRYVL